MWTDPQSLLILPKHSCIVPRIHGKKNPIHRSIYDRNIESGEPSGIKSNKQNEEISTRVSSRAIKNLKEYPGICLQRGQAWQKVVNHSAEDVVIGRLIALMISKQSETDFPH